MRLVAAVLLAVGVAASSVTLPSPAAADEVTTAQRRVDTLQALVAATTEKLVAGTKQWEADQAELRRVELALRNTERRVAAKQRVVDEATRHVDALARRMYMQPVSGHLQLAFTQSPEDAVEAIQAQDTVARVAGADGQAILDAKRAKLSLRREQQQVERYAATARRLVARSAERLADLKALAADTATQLDLAQSGLARARAAKARREAAAAKARASRLRQLSSSGGAACTRKSTSGQSNGNLDPASLCPLWMAPGHRLRWDAATAFNAMSKYHAASVGSPLCVTDSYRSYSEQVDVYRRKPSLAAVPGTSNHGWGLAVDFCGGIERAGSSAYDWMKANAGRFGWFHPDWAEPGGSRPEAWHWEFRG
jgi:hypothetical protein